MTEEQMLCRIKQLENALLMAGLPSTERKCECCNEMYMPSHYESCRCPACCLSCYFDRNYRIWIKGNSCPSKRIA